MKEVLAGKHLDGYGLGANTGRAGQQNVVCIRGGPVGRAERPVADVMSLTFPGNLVARTSTPVRHRVHMSVGGVVEVA